MSSKAACVRADVDQARRWREAFGQRVRELRTAQGMSQMTFAESIDLHPTYVSDIERGTRNVSLVNIHVLASGLDVPVGSLFA
jgi:transcriptional regulator with XRE-family HTH domain